MRAPRERFCTIGDVRLCYETFGRPGDPAALLIMGLGTQMLGWPDELCEQLAGSGRFVIRFDNRDCGRSTWFDHHPRPPSWRLATRRLGPLAYTLDDMAADAAGLLDHLGVSRADVAGVSMGGMIAQVLAATSPDRIRSLVSIMANTGSRRSGQPNLTLWPRLIRPLPTEREAYIEAAIRLFRRIGSPGFDRDEPALRELLVRSHERGVTAAGTARQLAAILAAGDRSRALAQIEAPTTVVHGTADRLVAPSGGRATARAIPGARLIRIDGMGHDLPRAVWPRVAEAILAGGGAPGAPTLAGSARAG